MREDEVTAIRLLREEVHALANGTPGRVAHVSLRVGDVEIRVGWEPPPAAAPPAPAQPLPSAAEAGGQDVASAPSMEPPQAAAVDEDEGVRSVVAPLVGTFYVAPEPGAGPFVAPGDLVVPGQAVGIVEAMKLMNQVTSDWTGEVVEVLVKDGEPVEYGRELVRIRVAER
ncbi:acetyl-CoA carboxylase biotin carboxyl carrier protein [Actinomadura sp. 9N215]|uniref:acetyl-CoA carboxylase biotin carboxyl carrier protein n=1 Tax=Actinomadura sp. 9N215 TaxID=3375150 RepID=UPI0037B53A64